MQRNEEYPHGEQIWLLSIPEIETAREAIKEIPDDVAQHLAQTVLPGAIDRFKDSGTPKVELVQEEAELVIGSLLSLARSTPITALQQEAVEMLLSAGYIEAA